MSAVALTPRTRLLVLLTACLCLAALPAALADGLVRPAPLKLAPCDAASQLTCAGAPGTPAICCATANFKCGVLTTGGARCAACPQEKWGDCMSGYSSLSDPEDGCFKCLKDLPGTIGDNFVRTPPTATASPPPVTAVDPVACSAAAPCAAGQICMAGVCEKSVQVASVPKTGCEPKCKSNFTCKAPAGGATTWQCVKRQKRKPAKPAAKRDLLASAVDSEAQQAEGRKLSSWSRRDLHL